MTKLANKNNWTSTILIAGAISLAGCGKGEPSPSAVVAPVETIVQDDSGYIDLPTMVEQRHFAIYSAYKVLFDDSAQVFQSRANVPGQGLQHAVMSTETALPACSKGAMLLSD